MYSREVISPGSEVTWEGSELGMETSDFSAFGDITRAPPPISFAPTNQYCRNDFYAKSSVLIISRPKPLHKVSGVVNGGFPQGNVHRIGA